MSLWSRSVDRKKFREMQSLDYFPEVGKLVERVEMNARIAICIYGGEKRHIEQHFAQHIE